MGGLRARPRNLDDSRPLGVAVADEDGNKLSAVADCSLLGYPFQGDNPLA